MRFTPLDVTVSDLQSPSLRWWFLDLVSRTGSNLENIFLLNTNRKSYTMYWESNCIIAVDIAWLWKVKVTHILKAYISSRSRVGSCY